MGRPAEFDRAQAVRTAMAVFLEKGFEATSVDDLTAALGISRASLYNAFGDKRGLLVAALGCAEQTGSDLRGTVLCKAGPVRKVLRQFFEGLLEDRRGCFFLTLGAELSSLDNEVAKRVRASLDRMRNMFLQLIHRGQEAGEISSEHDAAHSAAALTGSMVSILTLVRIHPDKKLLAAVIDQALATLD